MHKLLTVLMAVSLLAVACGRSTPVATDQGVEEAEETTTTASLAPAEPDSDEDKDLLDVDDDVDADADISDIEDRAEVSSLDDVPQVCQDFMSDFLGDIEPIVSPVDWENATFEQFAEVSDDFEMIAEELESNSSASAECDDIALGSDDGFDVLLAFAEDEAPGTVSFLIFLRELSEGVADIAAPSTDGGLETCDDAIAFITELMSQYESPNEVPLAELTAFAAMGDVLFSCTPEQLEFFDSPEVSSFFDDLG